MIANTGILRGPRTRCVDSMVSDDAVATLDTVTQLVAAMHKVVRLVPGARETIAQVRGWITQSRANRTSIGTTRRQSSRWCRIWSTTRWRCWPS